MAFNYQLEKMMEFIEPWVGRRLNLVPFVLSMGREERIKVGEVYVRYYDPRLEVEPQWLRAILQGQITLPVAPRLTKAGIWGDQEPLAIAEPTGEEVEAQVVGPVLPPDYIDPEQEALDYEPWPDDIVPDEPVEEAPQEAAEDSMESDRGIIAADSFKRWLNGSVDKRMSSPATDKQVGYAASMLASVFGEGQQADVARHQVLESSSMSRAPRS